jgi:hypothetical protein
MRLLRFFFLSLLGFLPIAAKADLVPPKLTMRISSNEMNSTHLTLVKGKIAQLTVTFTNTDYTQRRVLLPGDQNHGQRLIWFSVFRVDEKFYTNVFTEERALSMDTAVYKGYVTLKNLEPGESVSLPIFFNDSINQGKRNEVHSLGNLPPGNYQLLAWYDPWKEPLADEIYNRLDDFDRHQPTSDPSKMDLYLGGINSNYISLTVTDKDVEIPSIKYPMLPQDASANLIPPKLTMRISSNEMDSTHLTFVQGKIAQLTVTFTNADYAQRSVLLPGFQNLGQRVIWFSVFSEQENYYRNVFTEERVLSMDTLVYKGSVTLKNLQTGESVSIPIFFNDSLNQRKHNEAHSLGNLPPGNYQLFASYDPWKEQLSEYIYNRTNDVEGNKPTADSTKMDLNYAGINSNYVRLTIRDTNVAIQSAKPICSGHCAICSSIDRGNWNALKRAVRRKGGYESPHRNIAWVYYGPDAILSSLPTYYSRELIVNEKGSYHYLSLTWQLGKIFRVRERLCSILHWVFHIRRCPFRSSKVDWSKLRWAKEF